MGDWGSLNAGDEAAYVANFAALTGLAITESTLSAPSGAEVYRGVALNTIGIPNTVPGLPFDRVGQAWTEFANQLEGHRDSIKEVVDRVGSGSEDLWTGDGAEAFHGYANDQLIEGINSLIEAAREMGTLTSDESGGLWFSVVKAYAFVAACIAYQIAIQPTKAIPFVGMGVFAGLTWASVAIESVLWADLLTSLWNDLWNHLENREQLNQIITQLEQTFGAESNTLDQAANEVEGRDSGTILGDPGNWGKS